MNIGYSGLDQSKADMIMAKHAITRRPIQHGNTFFIRSY